MHKLNNKIINISFNVDSKECKKEEINWLSKISNHNFDVEYNVRPIYDKIEILLSLKEEKTKNRFPTDCKVLWDYYIEYVCELFHYIKYNYSKDDFDRTSIIKYIGLIELDKVQIVNSKDMFEKYKNKYIIEKTNKYDIPQIFDKGQLETNFKIVNISELLGLYSNEDDEKVIYICMENIDKLFNQLKDSSPDKDQWNDINILVKKVFYHEIGHLIFDDLNKAIPSKKTPGFKERQANFIASDATNGDIDYYIEQITKIQPSMYYNPLLSLSHYICKNKVNPKQKYLDLRNEYQEEIKKLFIGE